MCAFVFVWLCVCASVSLRDEDWRTPSASVGILKFLLECVVFIYQNIRFSNTWWGYINLVWGYIKFVES